MEVNGQLREVKLPLREVRPAPKNLGFLVPARATRPLHKERAPAKNREIVKSEKIQNFAREAQEPSEARLGAEAKLLPLNAKCPEGALCVTRPEAARPKAAGP